MYIRLFSFSEHQSFNKPGDLRCWIKSLMHDDVHESGRGLAYVRKSGRGLMSVREWAWSDGWGVPGRGRGLMDGVCPGGGVVCGAGTHPV